MVFGYFIKQVQFFTKEIPKTEIILLYFLLKLYVIKSNRVDDRGASDYLLKPVNSSQLLTALERMSETILQERSEKDYKSEFLKLQEERMQMERDRLFDPIVSGKMICALG